MKMEKLAWKQYLLALSTVVLILASMSWAADTDPDHTDIGKRIVARVVVVVVSPDIGPEVEDGGVSNGAGVGRCDIECADL